VGKRDSGKHVFAAVCVLCLLQIEYLDEDQVDLDEEDMEDIAGGSMLGV
jgi:hypothetical protein